MYYIHIYSIYIIYMGGWCCVVSCVCVYVRVCVCVCVCVFRSVTFNLNKFQKNGRFEVEDEEPFEYFFFP